jgi:hypothetical protein
MDTKGLHLRERYSFVALCIKTLLTFMVISLVGFLILPLIGY